MELFHREVSFQKTHLSRANGSRGRTPPMGEGAWESVPFQVSLITPLIIRL